MNSLPVAFGVDGAKYICAATIDVTQLSVAAYLYAGLHEPIYAAVLLGLTLPQVGDADQMQDALNTGVLHRPTQHITLARERESASGSVLFGCTTYRLSVVCPADLPPAEVLPARPYQERCQVSG